MNISMSPNTAAAIISWLQPVWGFMELFAVFLGLVLCGIGLWGYVKSKESHDKGASRAGIANFIAGLILLNLPGVLNILSMSIFNSQTQSAIGYSGGGGNAQYALMQQAIFGVISLVGIYGVVSGILMLRHGSGANADPHAFWHAMRRIIGGTLAVNIVPTLTVLGASLGTTTQSVISRIIQ